MSGIGVSIASVALGASVIEKHFTLDREDGGVDSAFSMQPEEMATLVKETKRAWEALGGVNYGPIGKEIHSLKYRRSLYVVKDIAAGERFTKDNLRNIRPGLGIAPKYLDEVIGKKATIDIKLGTPMSLDMVGH